MMCAAGGKIEFVTSGQVPIPMEMKEAIIENNAELEEQNESIGEAGFVQGMIPILGSGRDLIHHIQTGQWGWAAFDAAMLVWDGVSIAAGLVSFGTGTAVMQGMKGGIKAGIKSLVKAGVKSATKNIDNMVKAGIKNADTIGKNLVKLTTEAGQKAFKQAVKDSIDDIAKKIGKVCVFACFPAGTPISTKEGHKNIECIDIGDLVWSYNEETKQTALKKVVGLIENEVDATIKIQFENEVIETTADHPFYTKEGWKNAADLDITDFVRNRTGEWLKINKTIFEYNRKKVYNFEVKDFHNYYVGKNNILVHNSDLEKCGKLIIKAFKTPNGNIIKVVQNDKVIVPINKVLIYARGKVKNVTEELRELNKLKQSNRKLFDANPKNELRLKDLKKKNHNYERSADMKNKLESIGLDDTVEANEKIMKHLLETGKKVTPDNDGWFKSVLEGPNGKLKTSTVWAFTDDGKAYLSSLRFTPIN